jgi:hypothetical protein
MSNLLGLEEKKVGGVDEADPLWEAHAKSGANWFYWIAGLSVINSLAFIGGANFSFLAGLGLTHLVEAVVGELVKQGMPGAVKLAALAFDFVVIGMFVLLGFYANKRWAAAFIIGIVIYLLDGVLLLVLGAFAPAVFHAFALFFIIRGFIACRKLNAAETAQAIHVPPPPSLPE